MNIIDFHNVIFQLRSYKKLGETALERLTDEQLHEEPGPGSNSVSVIVRHLHGNMLSRWTDFLESDGEKPWRRRDEEFEEDRPTREELMRRWNEGWDCFLSVLLGLKESDLERTVRIRGEQHTVIEAIHRQIMHYSYHIGQLVYISKWFTGHKWESLSIPRGGSGEFNRKMVGSSSTDQPKPDAQ